MKKAELALIKLGGGAITDKSKPFSFNRETVKELAVEIAQIKADNPNLRLIIGNGAGSFGHYTVKKYLNTASSEDQKKYAVAQVAASVRELNNLVLKELLEVKLPAFSVSPSSSTVYEDRANFFTGAVEGLLEANMIPVVYGDIVMDQTNIARIMSTEAIFLELAKKLKSAYDISRVIYVTAEDGVLDNNGRPIPNIDNKKVVEIGDKTSNNIDVTGGMAAKLEAALVISKLAEKAYIIGKNKGNLLKAINGKPVGTLVG